jgi:predicted DNA-binding transcriptional regulator YafY
MRAYRLLSILLLLQSREIITARELSERLEVSRRTVYRDMDALAAAGAPVYAERGSGGGWRLLDGAKVEIPGLDDAQLRALQLGGRRDLLDDLGLRGAADLIWARLGEAANPRESADQRLLVDEAGWRARREDVSALPAIQHAVFSGRRLDILYERGDSQVRRTVDPLGLVAKGSVWYLVAAVDGEPRTYRVSRVREAVVQSDLAGPVADFRLRNWWESQQRDFAERLPRHQVRALARGSSLEWLRLGGWFASIQRQSEPGRDGFRELELTFDAPDRALAWAFTGGADVVLLDPPELRDALASQARLVLAHLASDQEPAG